MAASLRRCITQLGLTIRSYHTPSVLQTPAWTACVTHSSLTLSNQKTQTSLIALMQVSSFHTASPSHIFRNTEFDDQGDLGMGIKMQSKRWNKYNTIVYPPQEKGQPTRPAEVCHSRFNIKYSPKKMWYIAAMIRGMSVDEAMKQLQFYKRKGAQSVLEVLEEAQEIAVRDHNVEFKSNLWICDSFVGRGLVVQGQRKHRGPRVGRVQHRYVHYFVRLREGRPPKHYYPQPKTGLEKLEDYVKDQRERKIRNAL